MKNTKNKILVIALAVIVLLLMILSITNVINEMLGMTIALVLLTIFDIIVAVSAFKEDARVVAWVMIILGVISLVLAGLNFKNYLDMYVGKNYKFQVTVVSGDADKTLLFSYDNHDYYTYKLSEVNVIMNKDEKTYSLETALNDQMITLDEILKLAIPNDDTAGYKIYYDGGQLKYAKDQYSIVVCENGSSDIIFAPYNYTYEEDICK